MYKELYERWQRELSTEELQPLRDVFLQRLRSYIEEVMADFTDAKAPEFQRRLCEEELVNLRFMLSSLLRRRAEKIINLLLGGSEAIDYDLLTRQERRLVEQVHRSLRGIQALEEELFAPIGDESPSQLVLIRFLEDYPQFIGLDLKRYGPFRRDDLATLPLENARAIIRRNGAELISIGAGQREDSEDD